MTERLAKPDQFIVSGPTAEPSLIGSRCTNCGKVAFPKRAVCWKCFSDAQVSEQMGRTGSIVTFTSVHQGPAWLATPYLLGMIRIPEGPTVMSHLVSGCTDLSDVRVGATVYLVASTLRLDTDGTPLLMYKYALDRG